MATANESKALQKVVSVPLMPMTCIPAALAAVPTPSLDRLALSWTPQQFARLVHWLQTAPEKRQPDNFSIKAKLAHPDGHRYQPSGMTDGITRSLADAAIVALIGRGALVAALETGAFVPFLLSLSHLCGHEDGYRTRAVGTKTDAQGYAIRYPAHETVRPQLEALAAILRDQHHGAHVAIFAMNAIFNIHPFMDGNGRVGRMLFHLILRCERKPYFFIPIPEFSALSNGGFVLAVREAQYLGQWARLAHYIDSFAAFTHDVCAY